MVPERFRVVPELAECSRTRAGPAERHTWPLGKSSRASATGSTAGRTSRRSVLCRQCKLGTNKCNVGDEIQHHDAAYKSGPTVEDIQI